MIYFTDLDRTLIYSKNLINKDIKAISIEKYNGEDISFITESSLYKLREILKKRKIIPTTTRNIEQYERIKFKDNNVIFPWAIVCNGGYILHNGVRLRDWDEIVSLRLKECEELEKVREAFNVYEKKHGILKVREVYSMFFYIVVDKKNFKNNVLDVFIEYLRSVNWECYFSGRKIYFIPNALKKEEAVKYLTKYLGEDEFCAMGDSIMDLGMLQDAKRAYLPKNSYLEEYEFKNDIYIPNNLGVLGVEELLEDIIKFESLRGGEQWV